MTKGAKTQGIILKKQSLLNKDVLFTVFSDELGKVAVTAKGIKKITSRRAPHIQTGNLVEVELHNQNDRFYLNNSKLISAFSSIRNSDQKTNFMYIYFFILDRILPEYQQEPGMYATTQKFLFDMAKTADFSKDSFTLHLNKLLAIAGYTHENRPLSELIRTVEEVINEKVPINIL